MLKEMGKTQIPDVPTAGRYLWNIFHDLGCIETKDGAQAPISYLELNAFKQMTGKLQEHWEATCIRKMGELLLAGKKRGENIHSQFPRSLPEGS